VFRRTGWSPASDPAGDAQLAAFIEDRVRERLVQLGRQLNRLLPGAIRVVSKPIEKSSKVPE